MTPRARRASSYGATFTSSPDDARRISHRSIATALAGQDGGDRRSLASIARNWKLGGEARLAVRAYAQAASAALGDEERFRALEAHERYYAQVADRAAQRATIDGMLELAAGTASDVRRCTALCALGKLQLVLGRLNDSTASLREAVGLARRGGDAGLAAIAGDHLAQVLVRTSSWEDVRRELEALDGDLPAEARVARRRRLLLAQLSFAVTNENADLAQACGTDMLALGRETGDMLAAVRGHLLLAFAAQHRCCVRDVRDHYGEAIALSERLGLLQGMATALINFGAFEALLGRLPAAIGLYQRALEIASRIGSQMHVAFALLNLADAHTEMGDAGSALPFAQRAHDCALPTGERRLVAAATMSLGAARFASGEHAAGLELMARGVGQRRELGSAYSLANDLCTYALALFDAGHARDAHAASAELQALFETCLDRVKQPARLCWTLARDAAARGDSQAASE